jgi:hypothetical protein
METESYWRTRTIVRVAAPEGGIKNSDDQYFATTGARPLPQLNRQSEVALGKENWLKS